MNGRGNHADYMFGWKGDALQRAMNKSECFYDGCGSLTKQVMSTASKCTVQDMIGEVTDGCTSSSDTRTINSIFILTSYNRALETPGHVSFLMVCECFLVVEVDGIWLRAGGQV